MVVYMHSIRVVYLHFVQSYRIADKTCTFFIKVEKVGKNFKNALCTFLQSLYMFGRSLGELGAQITLLVNLPPGLKT